MFDIGLFLGLKKVLKGKLNNVGFVTSKSEKDEYALFQINHMEMSNDAIFDDAYNVFFNIRVFAKTSSRIYNITNTITKILQTQKIKIKDDRFCIIEQKNTAMEHSQGGSFCCAKIEYKAYIRVYMDDILYEDDYYMIDDDDITGVEQ